MRPSPHSPRTARGLLAALLSALAAVAALLVATQPAQAADTVICEQFGSAVVQGRYVVQNNRWGTSAAQCVTATDTGFRVTQADGSVPTNGAPKSYPSVFNGCHYTNCSPGTNLPAQVSTISSAPSSISYGYVSNAVYNASYDIWLDPTPRTDGVNRTEIMIWFNRVGPIQPIGSPVGTASVGGRSWEVWTGSNGSNDVISFVAPSAIGGWSFDVMDFVDQTVARGLAQNNWYLTSVQAGFEPWQNGAGLAVNSFSSTVDLGGGGDPGGPGGPATACQVTYATNVWQGGFTADVTVRNTGSAAVDNWRLGFTLPSGQRVTNSWNADLSGSSGAVTASPAAHNARIAAGGSQTFGFQGTYSGTFTRPTGFSLNGTACTSA
ncbi:MULTISPECIES: cellulose binding domain-containing protein [unclassified Streptomyces]|uniref:GH12 family glycosyl hydrolase domain-containing protein n=1 Tax=unclassified Streptomyces TaxID=2593676 RepID=UPI00074A1663|nr:MULTISPECIES: cellulose binding domain-containing protein [unclassified Streptomyces]KUL70435.1 glycosyl hydrolase family 5 [Streptomyces sp. NRRL WC-3604]KUL79043.1 glycosyl hydrolase family 5 [Streptomyces sp. NRRL WC-3605]